MQEKKDIEMREDIEGLIRAFYVQAMQDELIGPFFTEVISLDLDVHLPTMYDFWESLLFHRSLYHGGMMQKHILLNQKKALQEKHFERWVDLFEREVTRQFVGPVAEEAKSLARAIAPSMKVKLDRSLLPLSWLKSSSPLVDGSTKRNAS
ncbi:hypothetical protein KDA_53960 [Dictyobacter alpinus]|uniref:Group III truncated hemoglobin n=1 Tax=Dictyobacter alpinus TaxID=2014873 RepID=A0A402BF38_9CHLR|nr:group III truncated hemoglobin [Dictyobacter alpinus]GCE29912.1 hypothetical protein KDA_53960 [Dictyobacter alpinus]